MIQSMRMLRSQAGQVLTEIMVSVGVGAIVVLGLAAVSVYGLQQFELIREMNETEKSLNLALYHLRARLSQAVEICASNGAVVPAGSSCADAVGGGPRAGGAGQNATINVSGNFYTGRIGGNTINNATPRCTSPPFNGAACSCPAAGTCYGYDSTAGGLAAQDGTPDTVAIFNEEIGGYANPGAAPLDMGSVFRATGIYFRRPSSADTGVGSSGVLYIAMRTGVAAAGVITANMAPGPGDITINRLVSMRVEVTPVDPNIVPPALKAQRAKIFLTARYFLDSNPRQYTYLPWSLIPAATAKPAFKDVSGDIEVGFRDNALAASQIVGAGVVERLHGPIYYFRFAPPASDVAGF